jgi:tetratricopeptide (TPR) repeat protein
MDDLFARYTEALKQGHLAAMQGKPKDALRHYEAAAKLAQDRAQPLISMGSLYLRLGKTKDALAAFGRAVERAPRDTEALSGQAAALLAAGRTEASAKVLDRVSRIQRGLPDEEDERPGEPSPVSRSEQLHMAGEKALADGDRQAAVDAWLAEAAIHAQTSHLDAALDACQRALTIASGTPRVHLELATLYFMRGWNERAVDHVLLLSRLLDLEPEPDRAVQEGVAQLAGEHVAIDSRLALLAAGTPPESPTAY